jgi:pimeloyl-ACP methyl ester carboxylesterase
MMGCYMLVHGAWHNGEHWGSVRQALESRGHVVHSPTIGGLRAGDSPDIGLDEAISPLAKHIAEHDLNDIVLVGHSWGGVLISKLAERYPSRIRRLVFQNAFVLLDGESVLDNIPPPLAVALRSWGEQRGDGTVMIPFAAWRDVYMNDADLDLARESYESLRPQPIRPLAESVDMKRFYTLDMPKSYINAFDDNGLLQGEWGWHPRMSNRLGQFRLVQMPGGHEVMFTNPELLADKIIVAGRD